MSIKTLPFQASYSWLYRLLVFMLLPILFLLAQSLWADTLE